MLKGKLIHPDILAALGRAGHGSKILIPDGNYPFSTKLGPNADLVNLNLTPGTVSATQVLELIAQVVPIESAAVMQPAKTGPFAMKDEPSIWAEFRQILKRTGNNIELDLVERFKFYEAGESPDVCLTIATAEQRIYANILLTIGVVLP